MAGNVSYGTTFSYASNLIADVKSIECGGVMREMIKRTPLDTAHGRKLPGRPDAEDVTIELYYNETAHNTFWSTLDASFTSTTAPSTAVCIIVCPDGTSLTFNAYVKGMQGPKADGEDALIATLVLSIDGAITKA